ncbi:MAG: hypothetical protein HUU01_20305 [Saprospiraceae bacterium]|nr:hypothetical protein [Saprospiraceae bacterium]
MEQTFKLKNGEILLGKDKVVIVDDAKKQYRTRLISSGVWTFFGILSVLRYQQTGDQFLLWSGLIIGIGHLVILLLALFRTTKSEIQLNEILSMQINQQFGNKYLDIKLSGNKIRRVNQIDSIEQEVKAYIADKFG